MILTFLATYNRLDTLQRSLDSYLHLTTPYLVQRRYEAARDGADSRQVRLFIEVTNHAVDQLRTRFPEHAAQERWQNRHLITAEVLAAITDQRTATKAPRWAHREGRHRKKAVRAHDGSQSKTIRYLWTRDETRVYLVDRKQAHATVITTIRPPLLSDNLRL